MKLTHMSALASALFGLVACAHEGTPPASSQTTLSSGTVSDACKGAQFDADDPDPRCVRHDVSSPAPPKDAIKVTLHADSIVKSGAESVLVVEMRNVTSEPITLDVDTTCAFAAVAKNDEASSYESDCALCMRGADSSVLHVVLAPDGVVVKRIHFYAIEKRVSLLHDKCDESSLGPLPPGRYALTVTLPWSDPNPENPSNTDARRIAAAITVAP
jgi:hypothetical protein